MRCRGPTTIWPAGARARERSGSGARRTWTPPTRPLRPPGVTEADINGELSRRGREYIVDHPGYAIEATALNTWRLMNPLALVRSPKRPTTRSAFPAGCAHWPPGATSSWRSWRSWASSWRPPAPAGPLWMWTIPVLLALSFADPQRRPALPHDGRPVPDHARRHRDCGSGGAATVATRDGGARGDPGRRSGGALLRL